MNNEKHYMSDEMFDQLMVSVKQAVAITKGEIKPSRVFVYSPMNVREESIQKAQLWHL